MEQHLRAKLGAAFEARLAALDAELGTLLDREARLLLLADEEGLLGVQAGLAQFGAEPAEPASPDVELAGRLERLSPTRTFQRRDGTVGFVCDADVRTLAGLERVILWDDAVREAQPWRGKDVRISGVRERRGVGGRELHSTQGTTLAAC